MSGAGLQRTQLRRARKPHRCGCGARIVCGDLHLEHVTSPSSELGTEHWWRLRECRECAERYGRGSLFPAPLPPSEDE